jgi:hypothetical protein
MWQSLSPCGRGCRAQRGGRGECEHGEHPPLSLLRCAKLSLSHKGRGKSNYAGSTTTGIPPIRARHSRGPVSCTDSPLESTATVTGMSRTVNS